MYESKDTLMLQAATQHRHSWCDLAQAGCPAKAAHTVLGTASLTFHVSLAQRKSSLSCKYKACALVISFLRRTLTVIS